METFEEVMALAVEGCKTVEKYIREVSPVYLFLCFSISITWVCVDFVFRYYLNTLSNWRWGGVIREKHSWNHMKSASLKNSRMSVDFYAELKFISFYNEHTKLPKGSWFFLYHSTTATNREWTFVHFCYKNIIMKCKHKVDRRMESLYIILRSLWILVQKIDRDLQLYIYIWCIHTREYLSKEIFFSLQIMKQKEQGKNCREQSHSEKLLAMYAIPRWNILF